MNDETQPTEPTATPDPPAYAPAAPATKPRRGRLLLAGAAAGVALVAGVGGFAIGQATADDGRGGPPAGFGPGPERHGPWGFPGDRDGDGDRGVVPN